MRYFSRKYSLLSILCAAFVTFMFAGCIQPAEDVYYTVTFHSNGGTSVDSQKVKSGSNFNRPENPVRFSDEKTSYVFDDWYTSEDEGKTLSNDPFDFNSPVTQNIDLYAKWTESAVLYTVRFNTNGGSSVDSQFLEYGALAEKPANPVKKSSELESYEFAGWYTSEDEGETLSASPYDFSLPVKASIVLYAKWTASPVLYTVRFNSNGGSSVDSQSLEYGALVEKPANPVKESSELESYEFAGWYTSENEGKTLSASPYDFSLPVKASIVLYAKWKSSHLYYTVSFNTKGGSNIASRKVWAGISTWKPSPDPTKEPTEKVEYTFDNWYTSEDEGVTLSDKPFNFNTKIIKDIVLYAKWIESPVSYTVSFNTNGGNTVKKQSVEYGKSAVKPADPVKKSTYSVEYKFAGWYLSDDGGTTLYEKAYDFNKEVIKSDVVLYAKWTEIEITYTVKFESNGGPAVDSQIVTGGKVASEPEIAMVKEGEKTSYIFLGWYTDKECTQKFGFYRGIYEDTTLYAKWQEGFVRVNGGVVRGPVEGSYEFIEGRIPLNIPDMYVCDHEVTQKEYLEYCYYNHYRDGKWPQRPVKEYGLGDNYPIYYITFLDTLVYCNLRSIAEGFTPVYSLNGETDPSKWIGINQITEDGKIKYAGTMSYISKWNYSGKDDKDGGIRADFKADGYRLPTSVEWEYIAREGNNGIPEPQYSFSGSNNIEEVAWYWDKQDSIKNYSAHPVKEKKPNALGVYDMTGNVWEFCWDWQIFSETDRKQLGVEGPENAINTQRVIRGGDWAMDDSMKLGSGFYNENTDRVQNSIGFRVVRTAK